MRRSPCIALFTGDPAGIGAELVAKLLNRLTAEQLAQVLLIGQRVAFDSLEPLPAGVQWHRWSGFNDGSFKQGVAASDNGQWMLDGLREGLKLVQSGVAQALCFAPLNKSALRLGGMRDEDELRWFAKELSYEGYCGELNVLENLWAARVTSHVALRDVAQMLQPQGVAQAIELLHCSLISAGIAKPRIAVCGLNPHNGDNGNYGDEEARIIAPGIERAASQGHSAYGPFPADTAFVRALRKPDGFDGVVTMYHDQGQIAMKLLGFERGVTVHGGLPIVITTPAHGTAYDIAGLNKADAGAMHNAFALAVQMAASAAA